MSSPDLMAGERPAVRFAPVVNRFHEMIEEQMCREAPETPACAFPSAEPEEEVGENVKEFFPVCGTVFRLMSEGPRDAVPGDLRFVGEKARKFFPERVFKPRVILFVRFIYEKVGNVRIKYITICVR